MRADGQTELPGFEFVAEKAQELPSPPLWVVELLRLTTPIGVDVILTFSVVKSDQRSEGEGAVK